LPCWYCNGFGHKVRSDEKVANDRELAGGHPMKETARVAALAINLPLHLSSLDGI
jgi:hypothetical protein